MHWIVVKMKFERSKSVIFCEYVKVNQIHLGFIPKNNCPSLEISEYEIRCHVIEEEKRERKKKKGYNTFFCKCVLPYMHTVVNHI